MRRLNAPVIRVVQVVDLCASSIQDKALSAGLLRASGHLGAVETTYERHARAARLHEIAATDDVCGVVSADEMTWVYENTFVSSAGTRHIYDALKKQPVNDICPLCGQRTTSSLDHYLPKAHYPEYGITPINLVPCCFECNHAKRAAHATAASDLTLHPYFDDVDDARWLFARVIKTRPAALRFHVERPAAWDDVKQAHVEKHFKTFGLARLYASHSGEELTNILPRLKRMAKSHSPEEIGEYLQETADDCGENQTNSWRRATYDALAKSEWFCAGGFL